MHRTNGRGFEIFMAAQNGGNETRREGRFPNDRAAAGELYIIARSNIHSNDRRRQNIVKLTARYGRHAFINFIME